MSVYNRKTGIITLTLGAKTKEILRPNNVDGITFISCRECGTKLKENNSWRGWCRDCTSAMVEKCFEQSGEGQG